MAKSCSRALGSAPFCRGDFCGTRLQNRLDRVAVDFARPPAGSINSACQIFSLLCWAHSVAEQCINIHGDQSRASGEREYGAEVCVEGERGRRGGGAYSRSSAGLHTTNSLSSPLQLPSADWSNNSDVFMSRSRASLCTQLISAEGGRDLSRITFSPWLFYALTLNSVTTRQSDANTHKQTGGLSFDHKCLQPVMNVGWILQRLNKTPQHANKADC